MNNELNKKNKELNMIFTTFLELGMWWYRNNQSHLTRLIFGRYKPRKPSQKLSKREIAHEMRTNRPNPNL